MCVCVCVCVRARVSFSIIRMNTQTVSYTVLVTANKNSFLKIKQWNTQTEQPSIYIRQFSGCARLIKVNGSFIPFLFLDWKPDTSTITYRTNSRWKTNRNARELLHSIITRWWKMQQRATLPADTLQFYTHEKLLTSQNQTVIFIEPGIKINNPFVRFKVQ
jgi:hypothetical protein